MGRPPVFAPHGSDPIDKRGNNVVNSACLRKEFLTADPLKLNRPFCQQGISALKEEGDGTGPQVCVYDAGSILCTER